jgi:hypothetical protein
MGDMTAHGGTITIGFPTVLIGEMSPGGGASGGGMAGAATEGGKSGNKNKMNVTAAKAFKKALSEMPPATAIKAAQVVTLLESAADGTPFCEKCALVALSS